MESTDSNDAELPGKRRTWWHPLLARLFKWLLSDSCEVRTEVNVGRLPLRLDIVLIRRLDKEIPDHARQALAAICRRLNAYTLIEFKSPVDALERGDWNKVNAYAHLFVAQAGESIHLKNLSLMFLAPALTRSFQEELALSDLFMEEEEPGIHRIDGGQYSAFVIETERMVDMDEPALTLFSRVLGTSWNSERKIADRPRGYTVLCDPADRTVSQSRTWFRGTAHDREHEANNRRDGGGLPKPPPYRETPAWHSDARTASGNSHSRTASGNSRGGTLEWPE